MTGRASDFQDLKIKMFLNIKFQEIGAKIIIVAIVVVMATHLSHFLHFFLSFPTDLKRISLFPNKKYKSLLFSSCYQKKFLFMIQN